MKKSSFLILLFIFSFFLLTPEITRAFEMKTNDSVFIAKDETIKGTLYAAGQSITVDGNVTGDVICAGQSININGAIAGDVICAGQNININGTIGGSVRAAGNSVVINGSVARSVNAFGATVSLGSDASVGWDMLIGAASAELRGKIGGDLHGGGANVTIAGKVDGNIKLTVDNNKKPEKKIISTNNEADKSNLNISKDAIIGGTLIYTSSQEANIAEGALITGEITHDLPKIKNKKEITMLAWSFGKLYSIFATLVIGLVLISFWHDGIKKMTDRMLDKAGQSIGWGIVIMFLTPIMAILLVITLIGAPLALLLMLIWIVVLWISKIFVGILVGRKILETLKLKKDSLVLAMIVGIVAVQIIFAIPVIGWIACLVAIWWGLGGLFLQLKNS